MEIVVFILSLCGVGAFVAIMFLVGDMLSYREQFQPITTSKFIYFDHWYTKRYEKNTGYQYHKKKITTVSHAPSFLYDQNHEIIHNNTLDDFKHQSRVYSSNDTFSTIHSSCELDHVLSIEDSMIYGISGIVFDDVSRAMYNATHFGGMDDHF